METQLFPGAKLKIQRAFHYLGRLQLMLQAFAEKDFCRLSVEELANSSGYALRLQFTSSPSIGVALEIGDAIHNLRTALDHCWHELVPLCGGTCDEHASFPIRYTRRGLEKAIQERSIDALGSDIVDLLLDDIKSYKGGNDRLYALHKLDIMDKHQLLIPLYSVVKLMGITAHSGTSSLINATAFVGEDGILDVVRFPQKPVIESYGPAGLKVVFGRDQPFAGQPVVEMLFVMADHTVSIIEKVEKTLLARN